MPAPHGIRHGKAVVEFSEIEMIRDLHEYHGVTPKMLAYKFGYSLNTIRDWVYYRTRIYC
jgi:hypothetical protein